jgi:predicted enzyme related to lactoylglutathione lyase
VERVTGIGGVFFKAQHPEQMAAWYREHLGVPVDGQHAEFAWREVDRPEQIQRTVWSLFPADTDYFGQSAGGYMINYRVADLERMIEQLRAGGVAIERVEDYDYGRFAWITDPEGNRIELWQPKTT